MLAMRCTPMCSNILNKILIAVGGHIAIIVNVGIELKTADVKAIVHDAMKISDLHTIVWQYCGYSVGAMVWYLQATVIRLFYEHPITNRKLELHIT